MTRMTQGAAISSKSAVPDWRPGDTIPLGAKKSLRPLFSTVHGSTALL
jgi:hypothetical protein